MKSRSIAAFVFVVSSTTLTAQTPGDEILDEVARHVEAQLAAQSLVGLSVAVGIDGELVWTCGFGWADLENEVPATEDTVYRFASVSKPVTAAAVMQLAEAGELDLDAPIDTYVPRWPEKRWPVTARQLLCHQGGVRHYLESELVPSTESYRSSMDALERFASDPLIAEPGTKYSYSSYGYNLLGAAVEGASGMTYVEYLNERLLPAAGTEALQDDSQSRIIANRARGYRQVDGEVRNAMLADTSSKVGGGGLCGTAADLVRFAHAMRVGEIVREETCERMWTRQETALGEETDYGFGWFIGTAGGGRRIVRHGGAQTGATASLVYFVDDDVVVAMLCNSEWCDPPPIVVPLLRMLVRSRR